MKIKKILFVLFITFLLSGCTAEYNISIIDDQVIEDINIYTSDTEEKEMLKNYKKEKILSFSVEDKNYYYDKEFLSNNKGLNLRFRYLDYPAYSLSSFFNYCYDKSSIVSDDKYIYIIATGFTCTSYNWLEVKQAKVNFTTNHKILTENSDIQKNNVYTWDLKDYNSDISIILEKNENTKVVNKKTNKRFWIILIVSIIGIGIVSGLVLYIRKRKNIY